MMWFLAIDWVLEALGSETKGRMPLQADNTSLLRTGKWWEERKDGRGCEGIGGKRW